MSTFTELLGSSAFRDTHGVSGIPAPLFMAIARGLKCVLAADGKIHPAEMNEYLETCRRYGAPDDTLHELRDFDPSTVTLEQCFAGVDASSIPARPLLYDVIRIAKADGTYHENERAAVWRAAELLGIDDDSVAQITALADAEEALGRLRLAVLAPPGLRAYS